MRPMDTGGIEAARARRFYEQMLLIRRFEEKSAEVYSAGKIRGFLHLYIGEEAVAVGAMDALGTEDSVVSHYREHGHALARGVSPGAVMAEMYGKQEGCSRGRGGSMHLFDAAHRFYGGNAIVAQGLPMSVGLALGDRIMGRRAVTMSVFGDGASAEGAFHESLNLAALWRLPVLFLCENNQYAMGTAVGRYQAKPDILGRAVALGVEGERVDGMDVFAVADAAIRLAAQVREGEGPRFLECETYRFRPHSMFDSEQYRTKDEVEQWRKRDPLLLLERRARDESWFGAQEVKALEAKVAREVEAAVAFAEAGRLEPVEELERFVCTDADDPARAVEGAGAARPGGEEGRP